MAPPPSGMPYPQSPTIGFQPTAPQPQPPVGYPQGLVPPRKGTSTTKLLLIIGSSLLGLCCVSSIVLGAIGAATSKTSTNSAQPIAPPSSTRTTSPATTPSATHQATALPGRTAAAPAPSPSASQQVTACSGQRWPQVVPADLIGKNLMDVSFDLLCFTFDDALALDDGHNVLNDPAIDAVGWVVVRVEPTAGTSVNAGDPVKVWVRRA